MNKQYIKLIIVAFIVILPAIIVFGKHSIVINNQLVELFPGDSITFKEVCGSVEQTVWHEGAPRIDTVNVNSEMPYLEGFNNIDSIYYLRYSGFWDKYILTPIGFFFWTEYDHLDYEEMAQFDDSTDIWGYQSFDGTHSAIIAVSRPDFTITEIIHKNGDLFCDYDSLSHQLNLSHHTEELFRDTVFCKPEFDNIPEYSEFDIQNLAENINRHFADYDCADFDPEMDYLLNRFKSIPNFAASPNQPESSQAIESRASEAKEKRRIYHSTKFGIVIRTNRVETYRAIFAAVRGNISCASSIIEDELEYGFLIDRNPDSLTVKSAEFKVKQTDHNFGQDIYTHYEGRGKCYCALLDSLMPNTQYYYTIYCKIPKDKVGAYFFRYGERKRTEGYGEKRTFTTGPGHLAKMTVEYTPSATFIPHPEYNESYDVILDGTPGNYIMYTHEDVRAMGIDKYFIAGFQNGFDTFVYHSLHNFSHSNNYFPLSLNLVCYGLPNGYEYQKHNGHNVKMEGNGSELFYSKNGGIEFNFNACLIGSCSNAPNQRKELLLYSSFIWGFDFQQYYGQKITLGPTSYSFLAYRICYGFNLWLYTNTFNCEPNYVTPCGNPPASAIPSVNDVRITISPRSEYGSM